MWTPLNYIALRFHLTRAAHTLFGVETFRISSYCCFSGRGDLVHICGERSTVFLLFRVVACAFMSLFTFHFCFRDREDLSLNNNGVPDLIVTLMLVIFALAARKAEKVAVESIDTAQQTPQDYSVGPLASLLRGGERENQPEKYLSTSQDDVSVSFFFERKSQHHRQNAPAQEPGKCTRVFPSTGPTGLAVVSSSTSRPSSLRITA